MTAGPEVPGSSGADPGFHAQAPPGRPGRILDLPAMLGRAAIIGATVFVAVTAFVLAYDGSRGAASDAGIQAADWYPFCIEGVIVCASVATLALRRRAYPWVILLGFTAVSVAANVLHAWQHPGAHWWSMLFAAVPPLALPICVHLVLMVARSGERDPVVHGGSTVGRADLNRGPDGSTRGEPSREPPPEPPVGQAEPGCEPAPEPVGEPAVEPAGEPAFEPVAHDGPNEREPVGEPPAQTRFKVVGSPRKRPVQRGPSKASDPRVGQRFNCPCCDRMVSRMTLDRHAEQAAANAQSNGHGPRVSVP